MGKSITLKIDNQPVTVPEGTLIVDAAKKIGIDIPVFCYHPKLKPVGMCRMCLVDVGRPMIDRATGQPLLEADGAPRLQFGPKLETACTTPVSEGMRVVTDSPKVKEARTAVVECLLTSHPLDCPICDKGGECPLQNLTMAHGSGQSRFIFDEKMHLAKNVPLGELIFLDRERCIQCGRCTRFQHELVDDAVIGFHARGRSLEIVTDSQPGFDSIWSGNTTDICPVGALTTADFRFGARIWEMNSAASLCNQCPVGCNITFNVRREAHSSGQIVIKRVMPRQNEAVNETWICDKGRFGYHYAEAPERLRRPLIRRNDQLEAATWDEALDLIAEKIAAAGSGLMTLAGGRLSNEDLFNLRQLNRSGANLLNTFMAGGDWVDRFGLAQGSNLGNLGKGSVIVVVASDLHQEAPLWWLRIKQAAERGATLIVANPRPTRLDRFATHSVRYAYGDETATIAAFMLASSPDTQYAIRNTNPDLDKAIAAFSSAENAIIFFGSDGSGLSGSNALAQACAALLAATGHVGKPNNGLVGVWPNGNTQGAWDMGFRPAEDLGAALGKALVAYIAAADPAGDDPALALAVDRAAFVVVQDLFLTETAKLADVVLPAVPYTEREGTYTSGERRVQRFYPAVPAQPGPRADFAIFAQLGNRLNLSLEGRAPALIFNQIAAACPAYAGLTYQKLSETVEQWPLIGRNDVYYGGTSYDNRQGLGVQLAPGGVAANVTLPALPAKPEVAPGALILLPVTRLYDRGTLLAPSTLLDQRKAEAALWLHPETADAHSLVDGTQITITLSGHTYPVKIVTDESVPTGVVLVPRSVGLPVNQPVAWML